MAKSKAKPKSKDEAERPSFEAMMEELEGVVEQLEEGNLPLDATFRAYQRGMELLKGCSETLADMERRIEVLDRQGVAKPLDAGGEVGNEPDEDVPF